MFGKKTVFRSMPLMLLLMVGITTLLAPLLPLELQQGIYSCSLVAKSLILLLLPLLIFSLIFSSLVSLAKIGAKAIGLILALLCCSNLLSTIVSGYMAHWVYLSDLTVALPPAQRGLQPLWLLEIPTIISNEVALISGATLGVLGMILFPKKSELLASALKRAVKLILQLLLYSVPPFILGSVIKLQYEGTLSNLLRECGPVFAVVAAIQYGYLLLVYLILNRGSVRDTLHDLRAMIPAALSGLTTMSSAASLPLALVGIKKIMKTGLLADLMLPITVNIHLVGDCFAIPIFAYTVLKIFGLPEPSMGCYLIFALYFVMAKFSVAAVPGGGILVMLPLLKKYFGFEGEMVSLITALYMISDPFTTCANILGNGALTKLAAIVTARNGSPCRPDGRPNGGCGC